MFQAGTLAGHAAEQNIRRLERVLNFFINVADFALNVFAAAKIFQLVKIFCAGVHHAPIFIEARAENNSAALQNNFAQRRKNSARRTVPQNFFVIINRRKNFRERINFFCLEVERGASRVASSALYAKFGINFRVGKTFGVAGHFNRALRTNIRASRAARTVGALGGNHFFNLQSHSPPKIISKERSPKI